MGLNDPLDKNSEEKKKEKEAKERQKMMNAENCKKIINNLFLGYLQSFCYSNG